MTPMGHIGAFFDIDGTLLPSPSLEWRFATWLADRDLLKARHIARTAMNAASALLAGDAIAFRMNKKYLAGLPCSIFQEWEASLPANTPALFPEAAERFAYHFERGHRVFLISGTLGPLARALCRRIGAAGVYATELESNDGICSGRIKGKHLNGRAKTAVVDQIALDFDISLADSYAYGNHLDDLAMLSCVGHPCAVNPTRPLKRSAELRYWSIEHWRLPESSRDFRPQGHSFRQRRLGEYLRLLF